MRILTLCFFLVFCSFFLNFCTDFASESSRKEITVFTVLCPGTEDLVPEASIFYDRNSMMYGRLNELIRNDDM